MSSDAPSYAPVSPTAARASSSSGRSRSLSRRPSRPDLAGPSRSSGADVPPTPSMPSNAAASSSAALHASPHYATSLRSRHSLYGTEDRVVLDLGSRVWKVGFSGEPTPRRCVAVERILARENVKFATTTAGPRTDGADKADQELAQIWGLEKGEVGEETWMIREERLKRALREVWFDHLMTDPKTRKVLVLENPLLPTRVKEMIARILFDNLQVPSVSFASTPLLSLMTTGSVTGLVVDVGHLETTVLPVFHARPLFLYLVSTPVAGQRLNERLRDLLLAYGSYAPPPTSLNSMTIPQAGRIPEEVLTPELIEEIKTRCCFVGGEVPADEALLRSYDDELATRSRREPSSSAASAMDVDSVSDSTGTDDPSDPDLPLLKYLCRRYCRSAPSTTTLSFRVPHLSGPSPASGVGKGHLLVPGWIRERAAELLFDTTMETHDALSVPGAILDCFLDLPIDLRRTMAQSVLVVGGTAGMPGFIPRLKSALVSSLERSHPPSPPPSPPPVPTPPTSECLSTASSTDIAQRIRRNRLQNRLYALRHSPRYAPLVPLSGDLAILNSPSPSSPTSREGSAPAFHPSLYAWVGGSLAGALKVGGPELVREAWDELSQGPSTSLMGTMTGRGGRSGSGREVGELTGDEEVEMEEEEPEVKRERVARNLPDWTRVGF
ncbi:hypothetical protein JCM10212_004851 [Sporobolomyces blumeae]